MRRILLILACTLIVAVIVAPAVILWSALYTTSGLAFVVRHIPHRLGGVQLDIVGLSGTVAGGLHVERVEIDQELVHLRFDDITGRVAIAPLLLQTIRVNDATVSHALIQVKQRVKPPTPGPPLFLPRWLIINAEQAQVSSVLLSVANGVQLHASNITGAAVLRHKSIRIFQADGKLEDVHISASGVLHAADPLGMDVEGHIDLAPAGQPPWTVDGSARGDLNALTVIARVTSPFRASFVGQARDLTAHWHWLGEATVQDFDLRAWGSTDALGSINGQLAVSGDADGFRAHGQLNPAGLRAGPFEVQFSGNYANSVLTGKEMMVRHLASGARAHASGTIAIVDKGPRLDLKGAWNEFRWPLGGRERDVGLRSAGGTFLLEGILPYRVHLAGSMRAADLPLMTVDIGGTLDKNRATFDPAEIDLYGGHASVRGNVLWSPGESWSVTGRLTNINSALLRPDLPGVLNFTLDASGRGFEPKGELSAAFRDISGKLRGVPASGGGTLSHSGSTWGFSNVRVALGSTTLALDGRIDQRMDLRFALATEDLSLLSSGSRGKIKASGNINGTLADPTVVAVARGSDIEYSGIKVQSFDADVDFDPGTPGHESKIAAHVHKLRLENRTLESAVFTLTGPPAAYNVHFAANAEGLAASADATGAYAQEMFKGQLRALTVSNNESLNLSLERPVPLTVSLEHAGVDWLCVTGTPGSLCGDGDWTPAAWSGTFMADRLPLKTLTAGMTAAVDYLGTVSALAHVSGGAGKTVLGDLRAQLADAEIDHKLVSHKVEHTKIGSGTVEITATPTLIDASAKIGDGAVGRIDAKLDVQRTTARWQDMPVRGELHAHTDQSGLVSLYIPDIDRASGDINVDAQVSGTVGTPVLAGELKVTNGEIDVYQVNLSLRELNVDARLNDAGLDFKGSTRVGAGEASASGHVEWRDLLPYGKFHMQGTNLRVADVPEAQIDASPDLDFNITGRKIEVTGKVTVPYAKIQPKDITNAVRASPDEVIVGTEPEDAAKRLQVVSTITLALGDRVNLDALGLTAKLAGSVTITSGYDAITRGSGELSVVDGKYTAYARSLDIQHGRLIFSGGPIDNPGIDVRAVKQFPDVTAGVNVRGTLQQPSLSFFSDPPLPQSQIVSLILAGGSLESAQNAGGAALAQASALLLSQLGPRAYIPDVSLETDPVANETSLVLGRYLSPRLYVSYGVSLTETLNTFKLRYTLGDHWTIKSELGTARGADLVYTIER